MQSKDILHKEIDSLPDEYAGEILDILNYVKRKYAKETMEVTLLSETSLRKDWLSPEEDEAWQDL